MNELLRGVRWKELGLSVATAAGGTYAGLKTVADMIPARHAETFEGVRMAAAAIAGLVAVALYLRSPKPLAEWAREVDEKRAAAKSGESADPSGPPVAGMKGKG